MQQGCVEFIQVVAVLARRGGQVGGHEAERADAEMPRARLQQRVGVCKREQLVG